VKPIRFSIWPALMLAGLHPALAQNADLAGVLRGDRWQYEVTDEITGDTTQATSVVVISVSDTEIQARATSRAVARPQQIHYDRQWSRIDDDVWKYKPSDGMGIRLPLEVGKEWRFESKAVHMQNGATVSSAGQSKVVAQEKITTPAGTFDAFRIEITSRQVNTVDQTKAATFNTTLWYAPTVNRWVRRTHKMSMEGRLREANTEELTDYSRKP
jgi:hypothetical protein